MSLHLDIYKSSGFFQERLKVEFPNHSQAFMPKEQLEIIRLVIASNGELRKSLDFYGCLFILDVSSGSTSQENGYELYLGDDKVVFKRFTNIKVDRIWNGTLKVH